MILSCIVLGFVCGVIAGKCMSKELHQDEVPRLKLTPIQEALDIVENIANYEPYITFDEEAAIRTIVKYAREALDREDDLK